jgi:hypothetical protein
MLPVLPVYRPFLAWRLPAGQGDDSPAAPHQLAELQRQEDDRYAPRQSSERHLGHSGGPWTSHVIVEAIARDQQLWSPKGLQEA